MSERLLTSASSCRSLLSSTRCRPSEGGADERATSGDSTGDLGADAFDHLPDTSRRIVRGAVAAFAAFAALATFAAYATLVLRMLGVVQRPAVVGVDPGDDRARTT